MYRISQFAKMLGIPMRTIHSWERRYGILKTARGRYGHRLYDETSLDEARLVLALQAEGVALPAIPLHPRYQDFQSKRGLRQETLGTVKKGGAVQSDMIDMLGHIHEEIREIRRQLYQGQGDLE
jgi:DNA-binding transcriptional MerR regulator